MRRLIAIPAFIGFFSSLIVHTATYFNINFTQLCPGVWGLHIGAIAFMFVSVASGINRDMRGPDGRKTWATIFAPMPGWVQSIMKGFMVYAVLNFVVVFFGHTGDTKAQHLNGNYVLLRETHGHRTFISPADALLINLPTDPIYLDNVPAIPSTDGLQHIPIYEEISDTDYARQQIPTLRGFSGHWMLFYLVPTFYFWFPRYPAQKPKRGEPGIFEAPTWPNFNT